MKLTSQQITLIIEALRLWQRGSLNDEEIEQCSSLCELLNTRDVWAVQPQLVENLKRNTENLMELHESLRKTTHTLIDTVQRRCRHEWRYTSPTKPRSCHICGKEEKR